MMAGRYARAKQFKQHQQQLRASCAPMGRIIRDIRRKLEGQASTGAGIRPPAWPGHAESRSQQQRQRGWKLYSFHAPEVECIGKGKALARPTSSASRPPSSPTIAGLPVACSCCTPGRCPITPTTVTPCGTSLTAPKYSPAVRSSDEAYVDKGYRGHDAQNPRRVFISGQKRGVFGVIKRELRRRSAIEPIIGHLKAEGHLGRCYLKGRAGDAANVVLSAVGHNFRRILAWLREFLCLFRLTLWRALVWPAPFNRAS